MMTDFYVNTIGLDRSHEIDARPQPDGDHTGVPDVHRTLRFVGIEDDHEIELIYFSIRLRRTGMWTSIVLAQRISGGTLRTWHLCTEK